MTQSNYVLNIKDVETKVFRAYLTYDIHICPFCKHEGSVIKWNWKRNCKIKIPKVSNYNAIILLDKQRFKCKHCNRTFIATSSLVDKFCNISNNTKLSIKLDLMNKISEKDIAIRNNVSHNSVNRIIDSLSKKTVLPGTLPSIINIDEFKATYEVYQGILRSIKNKDIELFTKIITSKQKSISEYMKNTLKTFNKFSYHIINSFKYNLNNGVIEGVNNLIKCIKRIAFGYRSFYHFKTRIMLIAGIYKYN